MSAAPAFQFYANDFLGGRVATYTLEEIGLYSVLLAFDWSLTGLPIEAEKLAKLARVGSRKFRVLWATVQENFVERDGRYYNPRLELERSKQAENRAKKVAAAHSRWNAGADAGALQAECPSSPTPSPIAPRENSSTSAPSAVLFDAVTALLDRIPEASRPSWRAELASAEQGMHGPALTAAQVQLACRDYLGNENEGKRSLRHFRGYLRSIVEPRPAVRSQSIPAGDGADSAWDALLSMLPAWQHREADFGDRQRALPANTRRGLSAIGGFPRIQNTAADQRTWLKKEFVTAYRTPSTEPAHV